jgi:hypothetical protein
MQFGGEASVRYQASHLLPEIYAQSAIIPRRIEELIESDLMGMVIRFAGSSLEKALADLPLPPQIEHVQAFAPSPCQVPSNCADQPARFSALPDYDTTLLGFRYIAAGKESAELFRPGIGLIRRMNAGQGLPNGTEALLNKGRVRPSILNPKAYAAVINAGSLFIFKAGGPAPPVYRLRTLEGPRHFFTSWGVIRYDRT